MTKRPGDRVRGSHTGRPLMVLFDILGKRWTLRILWELRDGPFPFRALQDRCDKVSPTVLNNRLRALRDLELVELNEAGYNLTDTGHSLGKTLTDLDIWANKWATKLGASANE